MRVLFFVLWISLLAVMVTMAYSAEPAPQPAKAQEQPKQVSLEDASYEQLLISKGRLEQQAEDRVSQMNRDLELFAGAIKRHDEEIAKRFPDKAGAARAAVKGK